MSEGDRGSSREREKGAHLFANRIISVKADGKIEMGITTNLQSTP